MHGSRGADLRRQLEVRGGAQQLDGEEVEQAPLLLGREELGRRLQARGDLRRGEPVRLLAERGERRARVGPQAELGRLAIAEVFGWIHGGRGLLSGRPREILGKCGCSVGIGLRWIGAEVDVGRKLEA